MRAVSVHLACLIGLGVAGSPRCIGQESQPASMPATLPAAHPPGTNLLFNGDFELGAAGSALPEGWTTGHPANVRRVELGGARGHAVELTGDRKLMASYGVELTSAPIPVAANTRYRCTGVTRSDGPSLKVFVKGYATVTRRAGGELRTFDDIVYQMRKDIAPTADWQQFRLDFEIRPAAVFSDFQHEIRYVRVRVWAYWPEGTCWLDDLRFEEVEPLPEAERRHSRPVTHAGLPPALHDGATGAEADGPRPATQPFDEEQTWYDAANAFRSGDHRRAAELAACLLTHAPRNGAYLVLAARAAAGLGDWQQAEAHARRLLDAAAEADAGAGLAFTPEGWQCDWAQVVLADVCRHTGRAAQARAILDGLLGSQASPHARAAARTMLDELQADDAHP